MPTFHFTVISDILHEVGLGVVFDDVAAARAHAEQLAKLAAVRGSFGPCAKIQVTDASGATVLEVPVAARAMG
jgi:hypothetical protein